MNNYLPLLNRAPVGRMRCMLAKFFVACLLVLPSLKSFAQPLSGVYIVGQGETYATITAAINAVSTDGISGRVTFRIKDGVYNEQLDIANWQFGGDTVIFEGNSSDSTAVKVVFESNNAAQNFVLRIQDSRNIVFRYIHFKAQAADYARVVLLSEGADRIVFEHCVFENACNDCLSDSQSLVTAEPVYSLNGEPGDTLRVCDSLTFRHNYFKGGYKALRLGGCYNDYSGYPYQIIYQYSQSNTVAFNVFENFSYLGIELLAVRYNRLEANRLFSDAANVTGIMQKMSSVNIIGRNYLLLKNNGSGIVAEDYFYTPGEYLDIWNNVIFIYGPVTQPKEAYYGVFIKNKLASSARVYHNTVSIYSSRVEAAMAINSTTGIEIKQNIFAHYRKGYFISVDNSSYYDIDNNNYFSNGEAIAYFDGTDLYSTSEVISYGLDANPLFVLPVLRSTNDPIPLNCMLDNKALSSLVEEDFYGNTRSINNPDHGAVEFTPEPIQGGIYTVGQNGDFSTLGDALRVLSSCADLTGPLTLLLTDATYVEDPISVDSLGSPDYPIIIKPAPGVSPTLTIRDSTAFSYGIDLHDVQHLIIDGSNDGSNSRDLTLIVEGNETSGAMNIAGNTRPVQNVEIKNCNLKFIMAGNPEVDEGVLNFSGYQEMRHVTIRNNTISGGRIGISNDVNGGQAKQWVLEENIIAGAQRKGIELFGAWDARVAKNTIRNIYGSQGNESAGIHIINSSKVILEKNLVDTVLQNGYIAAGIHVDVSDTVKNVTIRNNIIRHVVGTGTGNYWIPENPDYFPSGVRLEFGSLSYPDSGIIKVYHNTIDLNAIDNDNRLATDATATGILATLNWGYSAEGKVDIRNNLIINRLGKQDNANSTRGMAMYFNQVTPSLCSNNIYHTENFDSNYIGIYYNGTAETLFPSMYDWRQYLHSQWLLDDRSFAIRPEVDSPNLQPAAGFAFANNTGVEGLATDDFGGNTRDPQKPDIGAWEYNGYVTAIKGAITSDTTWTGNLAMVDTVVVLNGKTLTIAPGTHILVADSLVVGYRIPLIVEGKLLASGTVDDTIHFVPATRSRWGGVRFETNTGGSMLSYLQLLADTLTVNFNSDTALVILNNPGITIGHLVLIPIPMLPSKRLTQTFNLNIPASTPNIRLILCILRGEKCTLKTAALPSTPHPSFTMV